MMNKFIVSAKVPILSRPTEYFTIPVPIHGVSYNKIGTFYINDFLTKRNIICLNHLFFTTSSFLELKFLNLNAKFNDPISLVYGDKGVVNIDRGSELGWCCVEGVTIV